MPFLKTPEYAADKIFEGLVNKKAFEIIKPGGYLLASDYFKRVRFT